MAGIVKEQEYRPERISRRGEAFAWGAALLVVAAGLVLYASGNPIGWLIPFLGAFLAAAGAGISLGNWMDRKTRLRLEPGGISYTNGLRRVRFRWEQIDQVRVLPAPWGKKVQVFGERAPGQGLPREGAYFAFTTLGEVKMQGRTLGRVGFVEGGFILMTILEQAGLHLARREDIDHQGSREYYSRE
jgi:hypothetical protein